VRRAAKFGLTGACLGFFIALTLVGVAYYLNSHHISYNLDALYQLLVPASMALMATERAAGFAQVAIIFGVALSNAILYAIVFSVLGLIWAPRRPKSQV
jgi:hypothetical protein